MKRLLKNSIYAIVIAAILFVAASRYDAPPSGPITGQSTEERASILVSRFNQEQEFRDFATLVYLGYSRKSDEQQFALMIPKKVEEVLPLGRPPDPRFLAALEKFFAGSAVEVFPRDERIAAQVIFANASLTVFTDQASKIRAEIAAGEPYKDWSRFLKQR